MSRSLPTARTVLVVVLALLVATATAFAQGGSTAAPLSGRVTDTTGAVIPGADVVVKSNATGNTYTAVTSADGTFTIPALNPGTYTVTVALMGFKTAQLPDVQVVTATPASVRVTLEVGALEETVVVTGATEIVQTQTASVQTTIQVKQIEAVPVITRTALDYLVALPGVNTVGSNVRSSTINGLPSVSVNITLDGINVQDNNNRNGDGFFMYIRPLLDSVEEVTVSTSTPGAESAGQGAAQIRMSTRSGTNRFAGSAYNTWRNQAGTNDDDVTARSEKRSWLWRLNTPYYFNKRDQPKTAAGDHFIDDVRLQTPGFRVGGPAIKDKLFYFFNWEWFLLPQQVNRTRYIMSTNAQKGLFTYTATDGSRQTLDLLALAASKGQLGTADPVMAKLLADIRSATGQQGAVQAVDPNVDVYTYSPGSDQYRHFPTVRLDYNLSESHRLSFTSRYNRFESSPDLLNNVEPRYPGFPNTAGQYSDRFMWQASARSTIGKNVVNEARVGYTGAFKGGSLFFPELTEDQFNCSGAGCQSVGGKGYNLNINGIATGPNNLSNATASTGPSRRYTPTYVFEDTLTWLRGSHTLSMGATYSLTKTENWADTVVPTLGFGLNANDPAYGIFQATSGNFPGGISTTNAGYAQNLYSLLTGRVTTYTGTAYLTDAGRYEFLGERTSIVTQDEIGIFISDQWRMKPNLTLTGGLRYQLQFPFKADNKSYARLQNWNMVYGLSGEGGLFKPGTLTGVVPQVEAYPQGEPGYDMEWDNIAPSIGATWRPNIGDGFFSKILSPDPVFRGGYSISYDRMSFADFTNIYANNPGGLRSASRSATEGTPTMGYDGWPVLLSQPGRLFPATYPDAPTYPFTPARNEAIYTMPPNLTVPLTHQWSFGWQRELGRSSAIEIRYVGNTNTGQWTTWNINSTANWNFIENGFLAEYDKARRNLRANIAAGLGNTFAYTGAPGTSPLPIFQAYFAGTPLNSSANQTPANYTSANYSSSAWYNNLNMYQNSTGTNAQLTGIAGTGTSGLQNSGRAANAAAAGLPLNFFQANPTQDQASSNIRLNGGATRYQGLQFEFRRRLSKGFLANVSYAYAFDWKTWDWRTLREDWAWYNTTSSPDHNWKFSWAYELPFGQSRRWGSGVNRWLNAIIGDWEFDGQVRIQSGRKYDFGGYRLMGMSAEDLQGMFKLRKEIDATDGKERWYMLPKDVIEQSIIALFQASPTTLSGYTSATPTGRYLAPATGPDCVQYLTGYCPGTDISGRIITGPIYQKWDFAFVKRFRTGGRTTIEARMDLFNVLDNINFDALAIGGSTYRSWELTSAQRDINGSQDAGGRITQFGLRFTW